MCFVSLPAGPRIRVVPVQLEVVLVTTGQLMKWYDNYFGSLVLTFQLESTVLKYNYKLFTY